MTPPEVHRSAEAEVMLAGSHHKELVGERCMHHMGERHTAVEAGSWKLRGAIRSLVVP